MSRRGSRAAAAPADRPRAFGPLHREPGSVLHERYARQVQARRQARADLIAWAKRTGQGDLQQETNHPDGTTTFRWTTGTFTIARLPYVESQEQP